MVGAGKDHSEAPSSSARGGSGNSIPPVPLRRALYEGMASPVGTSLSALLPTGRGGRGGRKRGGRGGRGHGRGRQAPTPSSPPPPADSPEHRTARVDPFEVEVRGLHTTSLGSTGLRPMRLRTRVRPRRRPDGVPGRIRLRGRVAMLMVAGMSVLIVRARWLRGPPCTSVVVHGSRPCRRPAGRGR
jgi:hypothetical protein